MPKNYEYPSPESDINRAEQPYHFTADAFSTNTKRKPQKLAPALENAKKMEDAQGLINTARNALAQAEKLLAAEELARLKNRAFNHRAANSKVREAFEAIAALKKLMGV